MEFRISNSKLRAWESMCPMEFKAKYITGEYPPFEPSEQMEYGNLFETLVIGGGINGAFSYDKSIHGAKMLKSVYKERVELQAKDCKSYLKALQGKILSRQEYIHVQLTNSDGTQTIEIEGTLDIRFLFYSGLMGTIDLKTTGDTENDFGDYAWGSPEKMDLSQIKHYKLLIQLKYKQEETDDRYWVFDLKKDRNQKLIKCNISDYAMEEHKERLFKAYNEISMAIAMDDFEPHNTWENCRKCKAPCQFKRIMPEHEILEL